MLCRHNRYVQQYGRVRDTRRGGAPRAAVGPGHREDRVRDGPRGGVGGGRRVSGTAGRAGSTWPRSARHARWTGDLPELLGQAREDLVPHGSRHRGGEASSASAPSRAEAIRGAAAFISPAMARQAGVSSWAFAASPRYGGSSPPPSCIGHLEGAGRIAAGRLLVAPGRLPVGLGRRGDRRHPASQDGHRSLPQAGDVAKWSRALPGRGDAFDTCCRIRSASASVGRVALLELDRPAQAVLDAGIGGVEPRGLFQVLPRLLGLLSLRKHSPRALWASQYPGSASMAAVRSCIAVSQSRPAMAACGGRKSPCADNE
jgi:hypothetical protein